MGVGERGEGRRKVSGDERKETIKLGRKSGLGRKGGRERERGRGRERIGVKRGGKKNIVLGSKKKEREKKDRGEFVWKRKWWEECVGKSV